MNNKKNFIWNFLGLSINSFNSLFFLIIVNRINGGNDGGIFTYAYSLVCLTYFIGLFFNRPYQITNPDKYSNKEFIVNRFISSIVMFIVTFALTLIFKYDVYKSGVIMLICVYRMLEAIADTYYGILQGHDELYKSGISMFIKGILGIILFLLIDHITGNMLYAILSLVIVNLVGIIIYDIPSSRKYVDNKFKFINILNIYKFTIPIFVFSFLSNYLINASKYTLDFYESAEIQNIFGIILMPGTIMSLCAMYIINPYLLELKESYKNKKFDLFKNRLYKILGSVILLGIAALIGGYLVGIPVLNIIYGLDLNPYKLDLLLIIVGAVGLAIVTILSNALTIFNKNNIQMVLYIINSIIAFFMAIILVKGYGILGATLTYLIIMVLESIEYFVIYNIYYKIEVKK